MCTNVIEGKHSSEPKDGTPQLDSKYLAPDYGNTPKWAFSLPAGSKNTPDLFDSNEINYNIWFCQGDMYPSYGMLTK
jgi:hypothetical protein